MKNFYLIFFIFLLFACEDDQQEVDVKPPVSIHVSGPLDPDDTSLIKVPDKYNADGSKYTFYYSFEAADSVTLIQQHVNMAEVYCETDERLIATFRSDQWEKIDFFRRGIAFGPHDADAQRFIDSLTAQAAAKNIELICDCYRIEFTTIFTLFRGTSIRKGTILLELYNSRVLIGNTSATTVKGRTAPSQTWTFEQLDAQGNKIKTQNLLDISEMGEATIDESEWWTLTDVGTFYYGPECEKSNKPPVSEHSKYKHHTRKR